MAIDFYQGFKMGIDSAASAGLNFKLQVFDTRDDNTRIENLIRNNSLLQSNLIVGPVFPDGQKYIAAYAAKNDLTIVSPLAASQPSEFGNPNLVSIVNNIDLHAGKIGNYISRRYNPENTVVVLISTKKEADEILGAPLRTYFQSEKGKKFKFEEYASAFSLETKASKAKKYAILLSSSDRPFVAATIDKLLKMQKAGFNIDLFGHPDWVKQNYTTEKLQALNTIVTSSYKVNYKSPAVIDFIRKYRTAYNFEPSEYAFKGFDIGYFFGHLLGEHGESYRKYLTKEKYKGLHNSFSFIYDDQNGYINTSLMAFEQLLKSYDAQLPLHRFLVAYFKKNKQMGSSDRRWASRYLYSFFRLGKALPKEQPVQRLAVADFLCNGQSSMVIDTYLPQFSQQVDLPLNAKITLIKDLYPSFDHKDIFPFPESLSQSIDQETFCLSFLIQPDLFIRVPQAYSLAALNTLKEAGIVVRDLNETTFALPNGTKLEQVLPENINYQVQDLSSQKTGNIFEPKKYDYWWDCCAASGGKSLLLYDLEPKIELLVSDVRASSLQNLEERFRLAGLKKYQKKVLDLLVNNDQELHHYSFDGIILDAPCSGSGTWGRTPEMLSYFEAHRISYFSKLQKSIAANVIKYLKPGKPLIYITCSVFKAENEDVVAWLQQEHGLRLEKMEVIKGYQEKADTMFAARLIKN
eukprot:gene3026-3474_t